METIKKILTAILKWLGSIPSDKLLHLIAGNRGLFRPCHSLYG